MLTKTSRARFTHLSIVCLSASISAGCWAETPAAAPERAVVPATIPGAVQWDMTSRSTGRSYRIFVAKPSAPPPPAGYPVIYVTDGNFAFSTVAMAMRSRQSVELRPAMVIGIGYPDVEDRKAWSKRRSLDLAPEMPEENVSRAGAEKGAEAFYRFLTEELRPALMADYSIDPTDQSLLGGSLGGLFTLYVLFNHPEAFSIYLAGSPSIWWNDRAILRDVSRLASASEAIRANLQVLITVGSLEQSYDNVNTPPELRQRIIDARMIDNARELTARLQTLGLGRVEFQILEAETHASVWPTTYSRGLSFAFKSRTVDKTISSKH